VYLYANNVEEQYSFIDAAKAKGYDVLVMDGQLDTHFLNHLEQKFKNSRFTRVDSDVIDKLIEKGENKESKLTVEQQNRLRPVFRSPLSEKANYLISFEALSEEDHPIIITQAEFMRRMKEMSALGGGMNFYGELPDSYTVVVNSNHPLVLRIQAELEKKLAGELTKIDDKIKPLNDSKVELDKANKEKKEEEISQEDKDRTEELSKKIKELEEKKEKMLKKFGSGNKLVKQIIDLALLANGMLKGEDLSKFVKRSIELI
jgi:molecular chaperone HtpG